MNTMKDIMSKINFLSLALMLLGGFMAGYVYARESVYKVMSSSDNRVLSNKDMCDATESLNTTESSVEDTEVFFTSCGGFY